MDYRQFKLPLTFFGLFAWRCIRLDIEKYFEWFDHFDEGVYFVTPERKILYFNEASEEISGFKRTEVVGSFCYDNILNHVSEDGTSLCFHGCPLQNSIQEKKLNNGEVYLHHKSGQRVKVSIKTLPVIEEGKVVGALEIFSPVDKRNIFRQSLEYYKKKAQTDSLTGLNNRTVLEDSVPQLLKSSKDISFGVVFADIDNFKSFNDTYGHAVGDLALEVASKTLEQTIRKSDIVIRYGGEEFMVLAYDVDAKKLKALAEELRIMIEASTISRGDLDLNFTMSIGATLLREGEMLEDTIKRADKAMYESKQNGKNKVTMI